MKRFLIGLATLLCGFLAFRALHSEHAWNALPFARFPAAEFRPTEDLSTCLTAIAAQSDPSKLATLGGRQSNPRLKRILYYLAEARATGADPGHVIERAQRQNGSYGTPRAPLVKTSLLRNLKICDGLGLLTTQNLELLKRGNAPFATRGPYQGQEVQVDHIVPRAICDTLDNELANLELLPAGLNMAKGASVGERQVAMAMRFHAAGLLDGTALAKVQEAFRPAEKAKYEIRER